MKDVKNLLLKSSMMYGLIMGLFWAFKYIFYMLSISYPFFSIIYWGLTFSVPLLLALLILHFRVVSPGGVSFSRDWTLGVLIFFFAALVVSLEHYIFYRYVAPPNFIADSFSSAIDILKDSNLSEEVKSTIESMATPTPIQMTIQGLFNNLFYGILIAIPVAAITSRLKKNIKNIEKL